MELKTENDFFVSVCYEVLDERVSKTSIIQDQEIWVKNVETEKESKLNFKTFNIDVRPGHKLLLITNRNTGKVERAINLTTDQVFVGNGDVNNKKVSQTSMLANTLFALLYAFLISLPYVSFIGVIAWWGDKSRQFDLKKYLYPTLAIFASYLFWTYRILTGDDTGTKSELIQSFIAYILTLTLPVFLFSLKVFKEDGDSVRNEIASLKDYQERQIDFYKNNNL